MTTGARPTTIVTVLGAIIAGLAGLGCGATEGVPVLDTPVAGYVSPASGACQTPQNDEEMVGEIVRLVNEVRTGEGLDPVTVDPLLATMAGDYACTMIHDEYFGHYHPDTGEGPGQRATDVGYSYRAVGENLAAGQKTPDEVMRDWMNSTEGHRENILNPMWVHIGVGIRTGGPYGVYWVQEFGAPWRSILP